MARFSVDFDGDLSTTDDRVPFRSFDAATNAINDRGFSSFRVQDNRRGGGGNLGSFGSDEGGRRAGFAALNEARPVRSGLFGGNGGGLLGRLFGGGGQRGGIFNLTGPRDFIDGGGLGASGPQFQGGAYSGLLNLAGVSPLGQGLRAQMAPSPAMAPQGTRQLPPAALRPVQTPTMTPGSASQPVTRLPINMQGMVQGSGQTPATGYVGADTRRMVQGSGQTPATGYVSTDTRRMVQGSGQTPATGYVSTDTAGPIAPTEMNLSLLPRATPDINQLEAYLSGQPDAMTRPPQAPTMSGNQAVGNRPDVNTPQMDFNTVRPGVSRAGGRIPPMMGFPPNVNTLSATRSGFTSPPPAAQSARLPINMQGVIAGSGQTPATGYAPPPRGNLNAPRTAYERIFGIGQYGILGR